MPPFKEVKPKKTYMYIVDQIFEAVRSGAIKPGETLPSEHQMAQAFNVSRSSVREALSALKLVGIVESRAGLGTIIRTPDAQTDFLERATHLLYLLKEESPLELLEARLSVEPHVAALAAKNRTEEDIDRCRSLLETMEQSVAEGKPHLRFDSQFHVTIAEMSQNSVLVDVVRDLHNRMEGESWRTFKLLSLDQKERMITYHADHKEIFTAVKEQDEEKAQAAMRRHIEQIGQDFLQH